MTLLHNHHVPTINITIYKTYIDHLAQHLTPEEQFTWFQYYHNHYHRYSIKNNENIRDLWLYWLQTAAYNNHPAAEQYLCDTYSNNYVIPHDVRRATHWQQRINNRELTPEDTNTFLRQMLFIYKHIQQKFPDLYKMYLIEYNANSDNAIIPYIFAEHLRKEKKWRTLTDKEHHDIYAKYNLSSARGFPPGAQKAAEYIAKYNDILRIPDMEHITHISRILPHLRTKKQQYHLRIYAAQYPENYLHLQQQYTITQEKLTSQEPQINPQFTNLEEYLTYNRKLTDIYEDHIPHIITRLTQLSYQPGNDWVYPRLAMLHLMPTHKKNSNPNAAYNVMERNTNE